MTDSIYSKMGSFIPTNYGSNSLDLTDKDIFKILKTWIRFGIYVEMDASYLEWDKIILLTKEKIHHLGITTMLHYKRIYCMGLN